jgi:hypothetical protein
MRRDDPLAQVVVPPYRSMDSGTLGSNVDGASIRVDGFLELL